MRLIKRPENFNYKEIRVPISTLPDFPKECPCCEAELINVKEGICPEAHYECGGKYATISQIQNHTDIFRGGCGLEAPFNEQDRVLMLVIIYNMFCNWTMFPKELKEKMGTEVPTEKDHVVYKISVKGGNRLSAPHDFVDRYVKWVEENFDKYKPVIEICRGKNSYGRFLDPRFICGFTDEWEPIYEIDPIECLKRLKEVGHNEYGDIQFHSSFGGGGILPVENNVEYLIGEIKTI